jgi:hypothetical protein
MQTAQTTTAKIDFPALTAYAKSFSGLTPEREKLLVEVGQRLSPRLAELTDRFYDTLTSIPKTAAVLEGRVDSLKKTHVAWLQRLLEGPFDDAYTASIYKIGDVHVKVNLPVEFMAGGTTLINDHFIRLVCESFSDDPSEQLKALGAVNAAMGFSLMVMQESYQASSLSEELDRFLKITGMSRVLFNNLASAYKT